MAWWTNVGSQNNNAYAYFNAEDDIIYNSSEERNDDDNGDNDGDNDHDNDDDNDDDDDDDDDDEDISYVYIRGHSNLPYLRNGKKNEKFDIYNISDEINVVKITAAANGETNCALYDFNIKTNLIQQGIDMYKKFYGDFTETEQTKINKPFVAATSIAMKLNEYEKNNIVSIEKEERNIVSMEKKVLNKIIIPLSADEQKNKPGYMTVGVLHKNGIKKTDIYGLIYSVYRQRNKITGYPMAITMKDIIDFLNKYLHYKNVVLLDFSCSSYGEDVPDKIKKKLTTYLNKKNLHGGNSKITKKHKRSKHHKKYKRTTKDKRSKKHNKYKRSKSRKNRS